MRTVKDENRSHVLYSGTMKFKAKFEDYAMTPLIRYECPIHGKEPLTARRDELVPCCEKMTSEVVGAVAKR